MRALLLLAVMLAGCFGHCGPSYETAWSDEGLWEESQSMGRTEFYSAPWAPRGPSVATPFGEGHVAAVRSPDDARHEAERVEITFADPYQITVSGPIGEPRASFEARVTSFLSWAEYDDSVVDALWNDLAPTGWQRNGTGDMVPIMQGAKTEIELEAGAFFSEHPWSEANLTGIAPGLVLAAFEDFVFTILLPIRVVDLEGATGTHTMRVDGLGTARLRFDLPEEEFTSDDLRHEVADAFEANGLTLPAQWEMSVTIC